jgi:peptide/nickel transport system substrate-binding protein
MTNIEHRSSLRRIFLGAFGCTLLVLLLLTARNPDEPLRPVMTTATPEMTSTPDTVAASALEAVLASVAKPTSGTTPATVATPTPEATPTPSIPQGGVLTMRMHNDVPDLKPWDLRSRAEEYVIDLLYNGLVRLDEQRRPQPDLAERWEVSPDGGLITFTLRSDITWHDGQPLSAHDVAWTFNTLRAITPTNALLFDLHSTIGQVRAPLANTVVFSLTQAHAPLLAQLTMPILPRHWLQDRSPEQIATLNFWDVPVGSGPFKFDRRQADQALLFTRNDTFFRGTPNLEQVVLQIASDPAGAARALDEEQLLVAEFGDAPQIFSDRAPSPVELGAYLENGWYGLVFNMRPGHLFADRRLREALARSIDIPTLVQDVTGDVGQPIVTTILSDTWAYPAELSVAFPDLDEARRLLDEAGWTVGADDVRQRAGQPLAVRLWVRDDDPRRMAAAERIAEAAQLIGMQLEVVPANFDTVILAKLAPPYDFDLLLGSWINAPNTAAFPTNRFYDPDDYVLFHSSRVWQGQGDTRMALRNISGLSDPEYDQAAEQARRTYNLEKRAAAIAKAQAVLMRERPYLFLWTDRIPVALNKQVQSEAGRINLHTPRYLWNIEQWYIEPLS